MHKKFKIVVSPLFVWNTIIVFISAIIKNYYTLNASTSFADKGQVISKLPTVVCMVVYLELMRTSLFLCQSRLAIKSQTYYHTIDKHLVSIKSIEKNKGISKLNHLRLGSLGGIHVAQMYTANVLYTHIQYPFSVGLD